MSLQDEFIFLPGQGNPNLSREIINWVNENTGSKFDNRRRVDGRTFPDGESAFRIIRPEEINGKVAIIIQNTKTLGQKEELISLIYAAKHYGAKKVMAVVPFLMYRRQDEKIDKSYEIPRSKIIVKEIKAMGCDHLILCEIHSKQILKDCEENQLECTNIRTEKAFVDNLYPIINTAQKNNHPVFPYSPDYGGINRTIRLAKALDMKHILFSGKIRDNTGEVRIMNDPEKLKELIEEFKFDIRLIKNEKIDDAIVILIDDEVSTGHTARLTADELKKNGAQKIILCATHPVLTYNWKTYIIDDNTFERILFGNTNLRDANDRTNGKITDIDVSAVIAQNLVSIMMEN